MTESAPFSPADQDLLANTPFASCENLADAGRSLARIVPKYERAIGVDADAVRREDPLPLDLLKSLSDDVRVQQFYRTHAHFLSRLGLHKQRPSYGHNSGYRSKLAQGLEVFFTEDRLWFSVDVRRFVQSITDSAIFTVLLCIQKLLIVLLRIKFKFEDFGGNVDRVDLSDELQKSQRHLCRALIENAVDAHGVHTLLREALIEQLVLKVEKAVDETRVLEEAGQLRDSELYQIVARDLDRDVAEARPPKAAAMSEARVPTTRLSEEELASVIRIGAENPWSARKDHRTDPVDWLRTHYRPWIGKGLIQTDLKKADNNFYFAIKRRMTRGELPDWFVLPSHGDISRQDASDRGDTERYNALKAVSRLRNRIYRQRMQAG